MKNKKDINYYQYGFSELVLIITIILVIIGSISMYVLIQKSKAQSAIKNQEDTTTQISKQQLLELKQEPENTPQELKNSEIAELDELIMDFDSSSEELSNLDL